MMTVATVLWSGTAAAQTYDPSLFGGLKWRNIGPFRGGRCVAVAGSAARPKEYYFGATGGGVWKTTDGGTKWANVSDGFFTSSSVGALAVSASKPDVVYAGMGERDIRGDISHGDGVYKTTDGGTTWTHLGLAETQNISKIVVDPANPDIVYVAALGHVYGPNAERGVYKSTDGGKNWEKVLYVSDHAGAVDLAMDPSNAQTVYAATWEAWRTPYFLNSGGPGCHLFRTTDAGQRWDDLTRNPGLPTGVIGKIGITVSPADPKTLYASVEALDGGIFRSNDAGATWAKVNDSRDFRQRAWYYSHVYADPKNVDTVYDLNVSAARSTDGGKNFTFFRTPHGDNHDLWIAPDDPKRMIESNDGGANITTDGGLTWSTQEFATGQFYHVVADNAFPYHLLGAQQDNSSIRILSRTEGGGIGRNDWTSTAGGESGYITAKPNDPDVVFGGNYSGDLEMLNYRTNQSRNANPWPDNPMGWAAKDLKNRFQWTFPIVFSPNNPNELYTSSQYLYKSTNDGQSWQRISPDLTRNDPKTLGSSGGPITQDNTSVEYYATIFTVAESPKHAGTIWTGSDDGLVNLSRDGGAHWQDVTPSEIPKSAKISIVEASPSSESTAYLAVDNHTNDDYAPYVLRTHDFGRTWTKIVSGIPTNTFARAVREDPKQPGLLYLGTETGVFVSFNDGDQWQPLQLNLPLCPVHDLTIKDDDLCIATHGRAFWIMDDITPLRQLAVANNHSAFLYQPKDALRVSWGGFGFGRAQGPSGANPPSGVILDYYLPAEAKAVKFEFADASGKPISSVDAPSTGKGGHRGTFRLEQKGFKSVAGMIYWDAFPAPIPMPPGSYEVRMVVDGTPAQTRKFRLLNDPRNPSSDRDLMEQYQFSLKVRDRVTEANNAVIVCRDVAKKIDDAITASKSDPTISASGSALKMKLHSVETAINQDQIKTGEDPLNYPIRLNNKLGALLGNVQSGPFKPTQQSYDVYADLSGQLQPQLDSLKSLLKADLADLNALLKAKGIDQITPVDPATVQPPEQRRRRGGGEEDQEGDSD
jgi:photosystem II stability/assembly factor-like uncharacterized protein